MPDPTTTTLFRPVLITSAEQAEQLPVGARIMRYAVDESDEGGVGYVQPFAQGIRVLVITQFGEEYLTKEQIVDECWHHLVPVAATIEARTRGMLCCYLDCMDEHPPWKTEARYTTPWTPEEEA